MNSIAERLKQAREAAGMTQPALAEKAGVSQGTIGNIESGLRKRPRELLSIAAALGVNPSWLDTGKGRMRMSVVATEEGSSDMVDASEKLPLIPGAASGNTFRRAPVIAWARLGDVVFGEVINKADSLAFAPIGDHGDRVILVPIADDALAPRLRIGDMVAIDLDNKQPDRDQVTLFMAKTDGAFFLRRYQPLVAPHFEAIDAKNGALDSQRHGLEIIGVRCGVRLADI